MQRILKRWLPGVLASQIAFLALGLFVTFDYFLFSSKSQVLDATKVCLFLFILFGTFLFWGAIIGILEQAFFQLTKPDSKNGQKLLRLCAYFLSLTLLVIGPIYPLLESIMAQRNTLDGWMAYLLSTVISGIITAIILKIFAKRCANPLCFLLSALIAITIFFLAVKGTSLLFLLRHHFRPIQLAFYLTCWWGSLFSLGVVYRIGQLRGFVASRKEKISVLSKIMAFTVCPILAIGLCWIDSNFYVGLYNGAHLFVRILAYLLLDLFALTLITTIQLPALRQRIAGAFFYRSIIVIFAAGVIYLCFDLRLTIRSEMFLDGSIIWPLFKIKHSVIKTFRIEREADLVPEPEKDFVYPFKVAPKPVLSNIPTPDVPRVFIIVIDLLRADHLSCYGYTRETSPNIDAFAKEAVLFNYCVAPGCRTTDSLSTIFTSREFQHLFMTSGPDYKLFLDNSLTLGQVLEQNNFYTMAVGSIFPSFWGYSKGFQDWTICSDASLLRKTQEKIENIKKGKSFCYLHYCDLHGSVDPRFFRKKDPEFRKIAFGSGKTDTYDTMIKLSDQKFAELMDYLKKENLYDESVIILTSDHGGGLGEHGYWGHARGQCYNGEVLVPLIIKAPGLKSKTVSETVGTIDLFPTILDLVGIKGIAGIEGRSIVPLMSAKYHQVEPQRTYFHGVRSKAVAVIKGDYKLIFPEHPRSQLYAFKDDPLELKNLISDLPQVVTDLTKEYKKMAEKTVKLKPFPAVAASQTGLKPGLKMKLFDNPHFKGKPILEKIVTEQLIPEWGKNGVPQFKKDFSMQWDGYINIPERHFKEMRFDVKGQSEIAIWIDDVKIMDATQPQRSHHLRYWEAYVPLEPGIHSLKIRLSEKKYPRPQLALFYGHHGRRNPIPPESFFHRP